MNCVVCGFEDTWKKIHAHMSGTHLDLVALDRAGDRFFYEVSCPLCDWKFRKEVNPHGRDAGFMDTYEREIRLVAVDLLLYHLVESHEKEFLGADAGLIEEKENGAGE